MLFPAFAFALLTCCAAPLSAQEAVAAPPLPAGEARGHWLGGGELDGRVGTDELVAAGFDGAVVLRSRPPGCALPGAAEAPARPPVAPPRIVRRQVGP